MFQYLLGQTLKNHPYRGILIKSESVMGHSHLVWLVLRVPSLHGLVFIQKTFCDLYIYVTDCNRVEVTLLAV